MKWNERLCSPKNLIRGFWGGRSPKEQKSYEMESISTLQFILAVFYNGRIKEKMYDEYKYFYNYYRTHRTLDNLAPIE